MALPVFCLSYAGLAVISKLTRASVLENLRADFVRTARAKGVGESAVLWRHVFRNSLLPLITVAAHILPGMLAGSVVIEVIFSIQGMGKLIVEAIRLKDQEVVMAVTMIAGVLTLLSNVLADVLYAAADPRVSYE
jgi:peptide/nickel transport system permease protein